jgi:hypothetical protein
VIQYGLPDRLLFGRVENLMFADPPPTRLGHECLTSACQPLRPPVVHRLERDLEHRGDILASPARYPTSSFTQGSTTQNAYRFGSIRANGHRSPWGSGSASVSMVNAETRLALGAEAGGRDRWSLPSALPDAARPPRWP